MTQFEVRGPDNAFYRRFAAANRVEAAAVVTSMSLNESKELLSIWEDEARDAFLQVQGGIPWPYRDKRKMTPDTEPWDTPDARAWRGRAIATLIDLAGGPIDEHVAISMFDAGRAYERRAVERDDPKDPTAKVGPALSPTPSGSPQGHGVVPLSGESIEEGTG